MSTSADLVGGRTIRRAIPGLAWLAGLACAAGCGASEKNAAAYPTAHSVMCKYAGLEYAETPQNHVNTDSITLYAVYHFSEPNVAPPKQPLSLMFQVDRSRVNELRGRLESRPEVECTPESGTQQYRPQVEPFGDIRGEPVH